MEQPTISFGQFIKLLSADDIDKFVKAVIREHSDYAWMMLNKKQTIYDWLTLSFTALKTDDGIEFWEKKVQQYTKTKKTEK
jgi:hypothetical protein